MSIDWYRQSYRCAHSMGMLFDFILIGVGFCVARSTMVGNAKASVRGMSNRYRLPRFFRIFTLNLIFNRSFCEFCMVDAIGDVW